MRTISPAINHLTSLHVRHRIVIHRSQINQNRKVNARAIGVLNVTQRISAIARCTNHHNIINTTAALNVIRPRTTTDEIGQITTNHNIITGQQINNANPARSAQSDIVVTSGYIATHIACASCRAGATCHQQSWHWSHG